MNQKKTVLILVLAFVVLLGGAYVLYAKLGNSFAPNQLAVEEPPKTEEQPDSEENAEEEGNTQEQDTAEKQTAPLAPDFTVYDKEGNAVKLSEYIGKPIVLNFWASWCGPCKKEMPDFHEKYLELEGKVQFLMINMTDGSRETIDTASAFIEEQGYTFPVFYDTSSEAAMTYYAYSLPTTFFIDADGYAIAQATGSIDAETLQRGIDMILPEE